MRVARRAYQLLEHNFYQCCMPFADVLLYSTYLNVPLMYCCILLI